MTPRTTLIICGLDSNGAFLDKKTFHTLMDHLAESGGRLVLAYSTRLRTRHDAADEAEVEEDEKDGCGSRPGHTDEAGDTDNPPDDSGWGTTEKWRGAASLGFAFKQATDDQMADTASGAGDVEGGLPAMIPWRTTLYFDLEDEIWQTLYAWQQRPVAVQRPWGSGTVVMLADSYLFSNEAMRSHRCADLMAWLLVPGQTVIFDEYHHGLTHQPGIATLARQYRLHGVFGALLVVVALFGWRQAAVFVPPQRTQQESGKPAMGRDTGQGLVDLARRHISSSELLTVCLDAWRPYRDRSMPDNLAAQIQGMIQAAAKHPKENDPVTIYRRICELLKQGKRP